ASEWFTPARHPARLRAPSFLTHLHRFASCLSCYLCNHAPTAALYTLSYTTLFRSLYAEAVSEAPAADALPVVSQDGGAGGDDRFRLGHSSAQRGVFLPSNANPGRAATRHVEDPEGSRESRLHPLVISGRQQAWVVPAGVSGTIALSFAATGFYQAWLAAGLVLALAVVLTWALTERRGRRLGAREGSPAPAALGASEHSGEVTAAAGEVSAEPAHAV